MTTNYINHLDKNVLQLSYIYKKDVTVSCAGSDLLSGWALYSAHTPQNPEWLCLYWNTMLDQIRLWVDIDRNCNTFLRADLDLDFKFLSKPREHL